MRFREPINHFNLSASRPLLPSLIVLAACFLSSVTYAQTIRPTFSVSYKPPVLPICISIDNTGAFSVSIDGTIQTPIGTFSINGGVEYSKSANSIQPRTHSKPNTLSIIVGDNVTKYALAKRAFTVELPENLRQSAKVEYDGHGNIVIRIDRVGVNGNPTSISLPQQTHETGEFIVTVICGNRVLPALRYAIDNTQYYYEQSIAGSAEIARLILPVGKHTFANRFYPGIPSYDFEILPNTITRLDAVINVQDYFENTPRYPLYVFSNAYTPSDSNASNDEYGRLTIALESGMSSWHSFEFELDGRYHGYFKPVKTQEIAKFTLMPGTHCFRFDLKTGTPPLVFDVGKGKNHRITLRMRGIFITNVSIDMDDVLVYDSATKKIPSLISQ